MARKIRGWNDIPDGYVQEEDLFLAPIWLRFIARIKYLERFAYPIAVKKGLVKRWKIKPDHNAPEFFWKEGIQYIGGEYPGYLHGSGNTLGFRQTKFKIPFTLLKIFGFLVFIGGMFRTIFSSLYSTRWGRNKKTDYMKARIAASKIKS